MVTRAETVLDDGTRIVVPIDAILRRVRWAARESGLSVPPGVRVVAHSRRPGADPVQDVASCERTRSGGFRIEVSLAPAWLAAIEETLVHEVAHAVAWSSERADKSTHSPAWAACYGAIYAAYFDRPRAGPRRRAFAITCSRHSGSGPGPASRPQGRRRRDAGRGK